MSARPRNALDHGDRDSGPSARAGRPSASPAKARTIAARTRRRPDTAGSQSGDNGVQVDERRAHMGPPRRDALRS